MGTTLTRFLLRPISEHWWKLHPSIFLGTCSVTQAHLRLAENIISSPLSVCKCSWRCRKCNWIVLYFTTASVRPTTRPRSVLKLCFFLDKLAASTLSSNESCWNTFLSCLHTDWQSGTAASRDRLLQPRLLHWCPQVRHYFYNLVLHTFTVSSYLFAIKGMPGCHHPFFRRLSEHY